MCKYVCKRVREWVNEQAFARVLPGVCLLRSDDCLACRLGAGVCARAYVCIAMPVPALFENARTQREASNTWNATLAVGVRGAACDERTLSFRHGRKGVIPALDHFPLTQREGERLATISRRVELDAVF